MARSWLINSRGIAKKVRNASGFSSYHINDLEADAKRECPNCNYLIDNSDIGRFVDKRTTREPGRYANINQTSGEVSLEWPGLPAGVKFDPSDIELLEHLAGKVGSGTLKSHMFIDEFIPTLEVDQGICYTHPENLPGVKKDGSSVHFFHRTSNAYATGHRKRRKIHGECSMSGERVRWHKTGKTKPVVENGIQKGWKKIMVLYRSSNKGSKPGKANWVMHQYHLGTTEEEKDGELVVSKIFYQQLKQVDKSEIDAVDEDPYLWTARAGPRTPKTNTPQPPRPRKNPLCEAYKDNLQELPVQDADVNPAWWAGESQAVEEPNPNDVHLTDEGINPAWWAGESQAVMEPNPNAVDESLMCHEVLDSFPPIEESSFHFNNHDVGCSADGIHDTNILSGFSDLDNIALGTPPEFQLADLQFGSQESIFDWLDRL